MRQHAVNIDGRGQHHLAELERELDRLDEILVSFKRSFALARERADRLAKEEEEARETPGGS